MLTRHNLYAKVNLNSSVLKHIEYVGKLGLNIELCCTDTNFLYDEYPAYSEHIKELLGVLKCKALIHLPFYGIQLGCPDRIIRDLFLTLVKKGIDVAADLGVNKGVIHLAVAPNMPGNGEKRYLKTFKDSISEILNHCEGKDFTIFLENTREQKLDIFEDIFSFFADKRISMCLDIAHIYCHSQFGFEQFWERFHSVIKHIHLSDNKLDVDSHLALGSGNIDYPSILTKLSGSELTYTLEVNIQDLSRSLTYLERNGLYSGCNT